MKKSTNHTLSKRELEIMQVLWNEKEPLIATKILSKINDDRLSIFTVQNTLKTLMDEGFIGIASFTIVNKSNTRKYAAIISDDEYAVSQFKNHFPKKGNGASLSELMLSLLKVERKNTNKKDLEEITNIIKEEIKKIEGN
jgi:predicted transcriptional regulator